MAITPQKPVDTYYLSEMETYWLIVLILAFLERKKYNMGFTLLEAFRMSTIYILALIIAVNMSVYQWNGSININNS